MTLLARKGVAKIACRCRSQNKIRTYNVALKGLILMHRIRESKNVDKVNLAIKEKDWQEFINGFSAAK